MLNRPSSENVYKYVMMCYDVTCEMEENEL